MKKLARFFKNNGLQFVAKLATGNVGGALGEVLEGAGITKDMSEEEIIEKIQVDNELRMKLKELELQETQMYLDDVKNAREREKAVAESENATWLNKNINSIMAIAFMIVYFGLTGYVIKEQIESPALNEMKTLFALVVSYYFGAMKSKGGS